MAEEVKADICALAYIKIRDARAELAKKFDEEDKALKEQQEALKEKLLELCKETGADSIRTQHGTAIRSIKERYWTHDWFSLYEIINEYKVPELLERRISQANIKQFLEDNPKAFPPGLNIDRWYEITVRRASSK